jgi:cob(I)alamin adenosyltransferase
MKIYSGAGDTGDTRLFSGERVRKSHERIEAYGDLDELGSILGVVASLLPEGADRAARELAVIQGDLMVVSSWLATTSGSPAGKALEAVGEERSRALEAAIDQMQEGLPPLRSFILPGGHAAASFAHVARSVCRRAERRVIRLLEQSPPEGPPAAFAETLVYLNRLSDYLFVLARDLNRIAGVPDLFK